MLIADGAYSGRDNTNAAAEKNIDFVTTDLTGREAVCCKSEIPENRNRNIHCNTLYCKKIVTKKM